MGGTRGKQVAESRLTEVKDFSCEQSYSQIASVCSQPFTL